MNLLNPQILSGKALGGAFRVADRAEEEGVDGEVEDFSRGRHPQPLQRKARRRAGGYRMVRCLDGSDGKVDGSPVLDAGMGGRVG